MEDNELFRFANEHSDGDIIETPKARRTGRLTWREGLHRDKYNERDCKGAIHGEAIPAQLGLATTRHCVVRGIRYHPGFAKELHGALPLFTRALNARSIMSNEIPEMQDKDMIPYCIWHPDVASEETYRKLAKQYPNMKYQVGRACAAAGYVDLYKELELLPEVHIAEEGRESGTDGGKEIHDLIVDSPVRFEVMNDYLREVVDERDARSGAYLNGDTAVRWMLDIQTPFAAPSSDPSWMRENPPFASEGSYFNITEDNLVCDVSYESESAAARSRLEDIAAEALLYTPLPNDLPTVSKDLLISMAAYYGNVDRYARLRRPRLTYGEAICIVRGIYHNAPFAKWWSLQVDDPSWIGQTPGEARRRIRCAINARFIMSEDLSRISEDMNPSDEPYCIWYPTCAGWATYEALTRRNPRMKQQAARACIVADYQHSFDKIDPLPDAALLAEARASTNSHYLDVLILKQADDQIVEESSHGPGWKGSLTSKNLLKSTGQAFLKRGLHGGDILQAFDGIYDGKECDALLVELNICAPDKWKSEGVVDLHQLYEKGTEPV